MNEERLKQYVRMIIQSLYRGLILFLLSILAIVLHDKRELYKLIITTQWTFRDVFPFLTLFFSVSYIWYYTCKGSSIMIRRLQIWIGYTRAVILSSTVAIVIQYF